MSSTAVSTWLGKSWQPHHPHSAEQHECVSAFFALFCQLSRSPTRFLPMAAPTKAGLGKVRGESYMSFKEPVFAITIKVFVWSLL